MEQAVLIRAQEGDREAFASLVAPHRRELHVHCYRMLGSLHDAEDALQEVLLRAWSGLGRFERRASVRAWLYRIATNACLDMLKSRRRRVLPDAVAPPDDPHTIPAPPLEAPWLEPYPDHLLDDAADPARRYEARETTTLAFLAAIQRLTPRQRAVVILRDALEFSAAETADVLATTTDSVNASLKRARATLREAGDTTAAAGDEQELLGRYVEAWEAADVETLVSLLREDVRMTMPPTPSWYDGRDAVVAFLDGFFGALGRGSRLRPTRANGQPAVGVYVRDGAAYALLAIQVLGTVDGGIAEITGFTDPALLARFDLPQREALVEG